MNHQLFASLDLTFMALRSLVVASEAASESNLVTVDTLGDLLPAVIASAFEAETEATTTLCALELVQALLRAPHARVRFFTRTHNTRARGACVRVPTLRAAVLRCAAAHQACARRR